MDTVVAVIILTAINVAGWVYTKMFALGKLNEKVERHDKLLNDGLPKEVRELTKQVSEMTGTLNTYIDLTKDR